MLRLVSGNLNYSSWTIRAWAALRYVGADFRLHDVGLKTSPDWKETILGFSGAGKIPILVDGALSIHESLAICEYVSELYPQAKLWPDDRRLRARGRALSCEMLSGFSNLRALMPNNVRGRAKPRPASEALSREIARIFEIWQVSLQSNGGPFLLGAFSITDCMFLPVSFRFRTYQVPLPDDVQDYCETLWSLPLTKELEVLAAAEPAIAEYDAALDSPL